jgi:hypothetical protein
MKKWKRASGFRRRGGIAPQRYPADSRACSALTSVQSQREEMREEFKETRPLMERFTQVDQRIRTLEPDLSAQAAPERCLLLERDVAHT